MSNAKNLATGFLLSCLFVGAAVGAANTQSGEIVLENNQVKVLLRADTPVIAEYLHKPTRAKLGGNTSRTGFDARILNGVAPTLWDNKETVCQVKQTGDSVTYEVAINGQAGPMVGFDMVFSLAGSTLTAGFENVKEHGEYHLIDIEIPVLVSVETGGKGQGWVAIPGDCGRLMDVATANQETYEYDIDWRNALLCGIVYNREVLAAVDSDSWEDHFISGFAAGRGGNTGAIGVRFIHRLDWYRLEEHEQYVEAVDPRYHLKVQDSSKAMVTISGDYDGDRQVSWVDGAKIIREKLPGKSSPYYANKPFSKMWLDRREQTGIVTFEQVLDRVKEWVNLTDDAPHVVYMVGWQYTGHDTGYPAIEKVNERLGGREALLKLFEDVKQYNTTLSFHDNYDDAYPGSPAWDPDIICRDAKGNLMEGGIWGLEPPYLISTYKYAQKYGLERVRRTLELYPIAETYHTDVLAGGYMGGRKHDFDPESPAGAAKNFEGKVAIIKEFNKGRVDITTEDFTGKFVPYVGGFLKIIDADHVYFRGEEKIPLIPFIYHAKSCYGMRTRSDRAFMQAHLYGANVGGSGSVQDYYLRVFPQLKLYGKEMMAHRRDGEVERVTYEDGSYVEVSWGNNRYSVVVNGRLIAKDFTSFVPRSENVYYAYSRQGGMLSYPVVWQWRQDNIKVTKLMADGGEDPAVFNISDGMLDLSAEANTPYKVVYEK